MEEARVEIPGDVLDLVAARTLFLDAETKLNRPGKTLSQVWLLNISCHTASSLEYVAGLGCYFHYLQAKPTSDCILMESIKVVLVHINFC